MLNAISTYPGWSHTVTIMRGADVLPFLHAGARQLDGGTFIVVLRGQIGDAGPLDTVRPTEPIAVPADTLLAVVRFQQDTDA